MIAVELASVKNFQRCVTKTVSSSHQQIISLALFSPAGVRYEIDA